MRIVGGQWRARTIQAPKGETTRPTTDRVREALFSAIEARLGSGLGGAVVLDAFAGSGALGLEALSRGASRAVFVERDRKALVALESNIESVKASARARVLRQDFFALAPHLHEGPFALILLDPPYTLDAANVAGALRQLVDSGQIEDECLATWEHARDKPVEWPQGFEVQTVKRYGSTEIDIAVFEKGE